MQRNVSLRGYNTFGLDVNAAGFAIVNKVDDIKGLINENPFDHYMFLGGGSNVLFTKDFDGLIIRNNIQGIEELSQTEDEIIIKAGSGVNWHKLVMYCVERNYGGIENLSLIPGTAGAAPMQNIGAYGVELENVIKNVEALNLETFEIENFSRDACEFGYRESVFKRKLKGKYFISTISMRLSKKPLIHAEYGDIKLILSSKGIEVDKASIKDISNAVIEIRQSKLPDPAEIGNSGSFFKNPVIDGTLFKSLKTEFPDIKGFEQYNGVKVPAAWLIEQCGWKGKRVGETGSHAKQALVLVNYGKASGSEVLELAYRIIESVSEKFGIRLEPEVNII